MVQRPLECPLCTTVPEEEHHLFFDCDYSKEAWNVMGIGQLLLQQQHGQQHKRKNFAHMQQCITTACRPCSSSYMKFVAKQK
jgi:hypothetical protein